MKKMKNKGIIPINKPTGWTSFDVVNKIKFTLRQLYGKNMPKVGHLGTLDPMATGVLLVTVGSATKLFDLMQQKHKTYIAEFIFGKETDTLDITGSIISESAKIPTENEIKNVLNLFVGEIEQMPPKYSAKLINGKRAYELARNNIEFELKPKKISIFGINFISYINNVLKLEIECGSGTYIRSIGRDIAYKLGCFATMTSLVRTQIDQFKLENCYDIKQISCDSLDNNTIKINDVLSLKELSLSNEESGKILNGQTLNINQKNGIYKLNNEQDTIALINICDFKAKMLVFLG